MKKTMLFIALCLGISLFGSAQEQEPRLSPKAVAEGEYIKISYGQPSKRDRVIFGGLVPYNEVWRTGANEATEITFTKNTIFGGKPIHKGTYTLSTIPTKDSWTIILNTQLDQWGAYEYEKYKKKNILITEVPTYQREKVLEKFTIKVEKDTVIMEWDKTGIKIPYTVKAKKSKEIDED